MTTMSAPRCRGGGVACLLVAAVAAVVLVANGMDTEFLGQHRRVVAARVVGQE